MKIVLLFCFVLVAAGVAACFVIPFSLIGLESSIFSGDVRVTLFLVFALSYLITCAIMVPVLFIKLIDEHSPHP